MSCLLFPSSDPTQPLQLENCGCRIMKNLSTMACADPTQQLSGQGAEQDVTAQQAPAEELPASQSAESIARQVLHFSQIQDCRLNGLCSVHAVAKQACSSSCNSLYGCGRALVGMSPHMIGFRFLCCRAPKQH